MVHRSSTLGRFRLLAAASVLFCACGSGGVGNGTPRVTAIPLQITTGGTALSLDVASYVTDREGETVTYAVTSTDGGSFAGSTFTNTFPTMGSYAVTFTATDTSGNAATGTFDVQVTSANYAVVNEDTSGMLLLDTMTNQFVRVAAGAATPTFATGLADGKLVYTRGSGVVQQLFVFDPYTRTTQQVGDGSLTYVTYRAKTSDDRLILTTGTSPDTDLYVFNPRTNLLTEVSAVDGEMDGDALVNGDDLVFYERGDSGQNDIYYYDPTTDTSTAVSTDANNEELLAVLADDGIVFSRVGTGGEHDLFYFKRGTGVAEIGTNVSALATADKAFGGSGTGSQVVFTADSGASVDIYFWSPTSGLATAIATSGTFGFAAIAPGNEVIYRSIVSSTEHDLFFYDLDDATTGTVRNASDIGSVLAVTSDGSTSYAIVTGSGITNALAVDLVASPTTVTFTGGSTVTLGAKLSNGDVIVQNSAHTAIGRFDVSAGAWTTISGTGLVFGGAGIDAGDFVYAETVSAQTDLNMWDDSGTTSVAVSSTAGTDAFCAKTLDGTVLFTRVVGTNTNADLFVWDATAGATRLTTVDSASLLHDHSVAGTFAGTR